MHAYPVFTFSIVVHNLTAFFSLKPHFKLLKMFGQGVLFIWIQLVIIMYINTKIHAYMIEYYCYCLGIADHNFYCTID